MSHDDIYGHPIPPTPWRYCPRTQVRLFELENTWPLGTGVYSEADLALIGATIEDPDEIWVERGPPKTFEWPPAPRPEESDDGQFRTNMA